MEAAPGIERIDVRAVNAEANRSLYAKRVKIYPKLAQGQFRTIKWIIMVVTLGIYYGVPWLRWDRGATCPDQAVLLDFAHQRFFFFWPRDLGAGVLLHHRPADPFGAGAVSCHRRSLGACGAAIPARRRSGPI